MSTVATERGIQAAQYINGEWTVGEPVGTFEVRSPIDDSLLAVLPEASETDVDYAVQSAERAFRTTHLSPYERYEILARGADLIRQRSEELATIIVDEAGKAIRDARVEVARAAQTFLLCAEEAKRLHGETVPLEATPGSENRFGFTLREPVGVVCAITPFNAPLNQLNHKVPTAIAAGNTVVLKPAEITPMSAIAAIDILHEAGLPPGFVNMVQGPGETVGEMLLRDQRFAIYTFTGSASVGRHIRQTVGLRRTLLELGSNSGVIVHRDADLDLAADQCAKGGFLYSGQICISVQRVLVHADVADEFLYKFVDRVRNLRIGNPRHETTDLGPMISIAAAERAEAWVQQAALSGAEVMCGGTRDGRYLTPTVLRDIDRAQPLWCDEAFAPVVGVSTYHHFDDALDRINDSRYGLQAGVFTQSVDLAMQAARKLQVGGVIVNDVPTYRIDSMPYGGVKDSGNGREGVRYAMEELTDLKLVVLNLRERSA